MLEMSGNAWATVRMICLNRGMCLAGMEGSSFLADQCACRRRHLPKAFDKELTSSRLQSSAGHCRLRGLRERIRESEKVESLSEVRAAFTDIAWQLTGKARSIQSSLHPTPFVGPFARLNEYAVFPPRSISCVSSRSCNMSAVRHLAFLIEE